MIRYIKLSVLMLYTDMITQTILTIVLLHTILARVKKCVGEMDALNVHQNVVQLWRSFLADGTFMQLGICIKGRILLEYLTRI